MDHINVGRQKRDRRHEETADAYDISRYESKQDVRDAIAEVRDRGYTSSTTKAEIAALEDELRRMN